MFLNIYLNKQTSSLALNVFEHLSPYVLELKFEAVISDLFSFVLMNVQWSCSSNLRYSGVVQEKFKLFFCVRL